MSRDVVAVLVGLRACRLEQARTSHRLARASLDAAGIALDSARSAIDTAGSSPGLPAQLIPSLHASKLRHLARLALAVDRAAANLERSEILHGHSQGLVVSRGRELDAAEQVLQSLDAVRKSDVRRQGWQRADDDWLAACRSEDPA